LIFGRHDRLGLIGGIRDVVEIIAIVAAGVWAFYVFVYQNQVVPSLATPALEVSSRLERLGTHRNLVAIHVETKYRNIGSVTVYFLGVATAIYGERISATSGKHKATTNGVVVNFARDFVASRGLLLFSSGYVTGLGNRSRTSNLWIEPGGESIEDHTFYVAESDGVDRIAVFSIARYTRFGDREVPTRIETAVDGYPSFVGDNANGYQISAPTAELDLH